MSRKFVRTILLLIIVSISAFVGGSFLFNMTSISGFSSEMTKNEKIVLPHNVTEVGFRDINQDACCGHTDVTPPKITLNSTRAWNHFYNHSVNLGGTTIDLSITDDNPMDDFLPTIVRYHWDNEVDTELDFPYNVILPDEKGLHILYVFARDSERNEDSVNFHITVGIPPPFIKANSPRNNSVMLGGTNIDLIIIDEESGINQALYRWDDDQSNSTLSSPYDVVLPDEIGEHVLYINVENGAGNWTSAKFHYTVTSDPSAVSEPPAPSETSYVQPRRSSGFLVLPVILALFSSLTLISWRKRRRGV
ncbi:MAG: hypothetical protein JSW11_07500 [Candidatus Heimdallarchaeota archaeon]|nr:MAG: hypothetical protein JSW11_07500 [Candidatus Heimdallarchaeota archaeon]